MNNFKIRTNYDFSSSTTNTLYTKVLIVTDGRNTGCGFYQTGKTLDNLLCQNKLSINYQHHFIKNLTSLEDILSKNNFDAIVVNGTRNTIPYVNKKKLKNLKIPLIQFGGDISQRLGNDFNRSNFDFWFIDDANYVLYNPYVLKVGKNILPYNFEKNNTKPIYDAASFGFALPDKGFNKVLDVAKKLNFNSILLHLPRSDAMDPQGSTQRKIIKELTNKAKNLNLKIEITTELLSKENLVRHLEKSKNLFFLYEDERGKGEQISGVFEYAMSTYRNIYTSNCSMFRHVLYYEPKKLRLEYIIKNKNNLEGLNYKSILNEWSPENFRWYFDLAINNALNIFKKEGKANKLQIFKKKLRVFAKKTLENIGAYKPRTQSYYYDINNFDINFPKLNYDEQGFNQCINAEDIKSYENEIIFFNKICPSLVKKKNYQALSQYAILLRLIQEQKKDFSNFKILCVGAYEDVISTCLKSIGIYVEEVDPNLNYALEDFIKKPSEKNKKYDLIYSISVIEHIYDDLNILKICEEKLNKGGLQFHTVDYRKNNGLIPKTHYRVYDNNSINSLVKNIKNSKPYGTTNYDNAKHDFFYNDIHYNFASITLEKL